jgi:hypothetical protein
MSAASAEISDKRLADFGSGRMRIPVEECLCGHDHPVDAIAALRCLLGNQSLLRWMRLVDGAEPFYCSVITGASPTADSGNTQVRTASTPTMAVHAPTAQGHSQISVH